MSKQKNPIVYFDISVNSTPLGKIKFELFADKVPKTVENFRALCVGDKGMGKSGGKLHFKGNKFHRIIPTFMCQAGDILYNNGLGGESIYGDKFEDENFSVKHSMPGILSMANNGPNSNSSQFFITTIKCPHLDGLNVAFGRVIDGIEIVKKIEAFGTKHGSPKAVILIDDCGQIMQK